MECWRCKRDTPGPVAVCDECRHFLECENERIAAKERARKQREPLVSALKFIGGAVLLISWWVLGMKCESSQGACANPPYCTERHEP